tara:strand:+ start:1319 stop:1633 length:315 start_codon:yes stop_codon:yes gene_type:complete
MARGKQDHRPLALHVTNFLDALCTLCAMGLAGVEEANPLLAWSLNYSITSFLVIKFTAVAFATSYLEQYLQPEQSWVFSALLTVMLTVLCWHAYGAVLLATIPR